MDIFIKLQTGAIMQNKNGGKTLIVDKDGKHLHNITITDRCKVENLTRKEYFLKYNITETEAKPKHRYLYFIGSKNDIKFMKKDLLIKSEKYPKVIMFVMIIHINQLYKLKMF